MPVIPIATGRRRSDLRNGEYLLLELDLPGKPKRNVGVLLFDSEHQRLYVKIQDHWEDVTDPDDVELLTSLAKDFEAKIRELGDANFLNTLEDTFEYSAVDLRVPGSNALGSLGLG